MPALTPEPFDHRQYVPIILTRQGERLALRELDNRVYEAMTPLFVVHPVPLDPTTRRPKVSVEAHLSKLATQLPKDWGFKPALADLRWIDAGSLLLTRDKHPIQHFLEGCAHGGLILAPAISPSNDPSYRSAALTAAAEIGAGLCFRLSPSDWHDIGTPLGDGRLIGLLAEASRDANEVHLILDFEDQLTPTTAISLAAIRSALKSLPHAYDWASVTVAGTGMPAGTADIGRNGSAHVPRLEWQLWQELDGTIHRRPSFGDYGVQNPDPLSDFNPLFMDSSAQLRYTVSQDWYVARGEGVKKAGNEQIRGLAQQVISHSEYAGSSSSWGDRWLDDCANSRCSPGSQSVWRKVTTNHHLTFVVDQLASQVAP
jgi:Beta protein